MTGKSMLVQKYVQKQTLILYVLKQNQIGNKHWYMYFYGTLWKIRTKSLISIWKTVRSSGAEEPGSGHWHWKVTVGGFGGLKELYLRTSGGKSININCVTCCIIDLLTIILAKSM